MPARTNKLSGAPSVSLGQYGRESGVDADYQRHDKEQYQREGGDAEIDGRAFPLRWAKPTTGICSKTRAIRVDNYNNSENIISMIDIEL